MALVDGICLLPLVLPPTVVGFFLLLLFGRNGPLGKLLLRLGATIVFSWPATVIAASVVAFPLMYLTARAALEQVDSRFLEAARTLGASEWRVFSAIALPLAWPGVLAGTWPAVPPGYGPPAGPTANQAGYPGPAHTDTSGPPAS